MPGNKSGPALVQEISGALGRAVPVFCQRRGQAARVSGREPGPAGIYGPGRLRPDGDRAGGDLQPAGGSPPGVCGAAPCRGGRQDSEPRRRRHRRRSSSGATTSWPGISKMRPPPGRSSRTAGFIAAIWAISTGTAIYTSQGRHEGHHRAGLGQERLPPRKWASTIFRPRPSKRFLSPLTARAEKLAAVVVPDLDFFRKIGETDIYAKVKWDLELRSQSLEPYKRIRDFVLINEELPKTRLGKVKIYEAERIYQERAGKRYEKKKLAVEVGVSPVGETVVAVLARQTRGLPHLPGRSSGVGPGPGLPGSGGTAGRPGKSVQPQDQR